MQRRKKERKKEKKEKKGKKREEERQREKERKKEKSNLDGLHVAVHNVVWARAVGEELDIGRACNAERMRMRMEMRIDRQTSCRIYV